MSKSTSERKGEFGASHTSFYTSTEKQDSYESLASVLDAKCKDPMVRQVIRDMLDVCADITEALRTDLVTVEGSTNDFGDTQLSVDVSALLILLDTHVIVGMSSLTPVCFLSNAPPCRLSPTI